MDRTTGENYIESGGKRQFTQGPPATAISSGFMNAIQEEIVQAIELSGQTPNANDLTQLSKAIPGRKAVLAKTDDYVLLPTEMNRIVHVTKATAVSLTLPTAASVNSGDWVIIKNLGAGELTVVALFDSIAGWINQPRLTKNGTLYAWSDGTYWYLKASNTILSVVHTVAVAAGEIHYVPILGISGVKYVAENDAMMMYFPRSGAIRNLYARAGTNGSNGQTLVNVIINGFTATPNVGIGAGSTALGSDLANSATFSAGNRICFVIANQGDAGSVQNVAISAELILF